MVVKDDLAPLTAQCTGGTHGYEYKWCQGSTCTRVGCGFPTESCQALTAFVTDHAPTHHRGTACLLHYTHTQHITGAPRAYFTTHTHNTSQGHRVPTSLHTHTQHITGAPCTYFTTHTHNTPRCTVYLLHYTHNTPRCTVYLLHYTHTQHITGAPCTYFTTHTHTQHTTGAPCTYFTPHAHNTPRCTVYLLHHTRTQHTQVQGHTHRNGFTRVACQPCHIDKVTTKTSMSTNISKYLHMRCVCVCV